LTSAIGEGLRADHGKSGERSFFEFEQIVESWDASVAISISRSKRQIIELDKPRHVASLPLSGPEQPYLLETILLF
jgi:hypothetical protein